MHGDYILGVDLSSLANLAVDTSALEAAAAQLIAQGDEANAIAVATDINTEMDEMVGRLAARGGFDALVASGTDIENQAYDVVANYDPNVGDSSVPRKVSAIQQRMNAWQQQAYAPLGGASVPPPTGDATPPPSPPPPPPPPTPPDGGSGDFGSSGGGDSGDPGNIDWGDGEQHADRGGGGDDDLVPGGADQGFDASDGEEVSDRESRELNQRSTSSDDFSNDEQNDNVEQADETEDVVGSEYLKGIDVVLGARTKQSSFLVGDDAFFDEIVGEVTIPTAGANYTDKKTVLAVQAALKGQGFDPGKLDGVMGPNTARAIRKMQAAAGIPQTGVIDEGVISALKVTPGVLPPGVTLQQATAVEAQAALDAATAVEHAVTPQDLQIAATKVVDAAPEQPPELKQEATRAHAAVLLATTPAQVEAAKQQVQVVALKVAAAVSPGWWGTPLWSGAPVNRLQGIVGGAGAIAVGFGIYMAMRR